ncbi:MAG: hypothetical protein ACLQIB_42425 [Isosphaeraceae bacterium]
MAFSPRRSWCNGELAGTARAIRFHRDEVCDPLIAAGLRQRGVDVTTTAEAGLLGTVNKTAVLFIVPVA